MPVRKGRVRRFSVGREVAIGLGVYAVYLLARRAALRGDGRERAESNARRIVALERRLGIHVEPALQRTVLPQRRLVVALNLGYATLNVGLTVAWLIRLFHRRDHRFHRYRRATVVAMLGAQPIFLLFPVAPPRKLEHLVDTIAEVSGVDLDSGLIEKLYHPLAAMPSIHVTIAIVTARGLRETSASPLVRRLAPGYPLLVTAIVFVTANHYVLDAVVGGMLGRLALRLTRGARA
ncbi:MAG: phosphatase PAP2 family protein [Thermoleophilia bacterium]|nr:phosphatase PAP2 family protein [Thermoleophilia bacterium]